VPPPLPTVTQTAATSSKLQALNSLLAADGLSSAQIAHVDGVAQSFNDYSATDYSALVHQLELAAQNHPPAATAAAAQHSAAATNPSTAAVVSDASAPTGTLSAVPKASGAVAGSASKV
jgi:hypothetical protein